MVDLVVLPRAAVPLLPAAMLEQALEVEQKQQHKVLHNKVQEPKVLLHQQQEVALQVLVVLAKVVKSLKFHQTFKQC